MNGPGGTFDSALIVDGKGKPKPLIANAITLFRTSNAWRGVLGFDTFTRRTMALRAPPWETGVNRYEARAWTSRDDTFACEWLQHQGVSVTPQTAAEAIEAVAQDGSFHPVLDYIESLQWDGVQRIGSWLPAYLGSDDTDYSRAVGERMLVGAVARIMEPGSKCDTMVVLEGKQGSGKSTAIKTLSDPWFSDELADLGSKDAALQLRGVWMVEIAELDAMSRSEAEAVKAFLSRSTDRYRPPYGRRVEEVPRSCILVGTTNSANYLRDTSGNRRFWPVATKRINLDALTEDRDQLWAEAMAAYRRGVPWWLNSADLNADAKRQQAERLVADAWDEKIERFIEHKHSVSVEEILDECIGKPTGQWTQADMNRVSRVLQSKEWVQRQVRPVTRAGNGSADTSQPMEMRATRVQTRDGKQTRDTRNPCATGLVTGVTGVTGMFTHIERRGDCISIGVLRF